VLRKEGIGWHQKPMGSTLDDRRDKRWSGRRDSTSQVPNTASNSRTASPTCATEWDDVAHMTVLRRIPARPGPGLPPETSPTDAPDSSLAPALAALALGDYRAAAERLDEVIAATPDLAHAQEMLGGLALGVLDDYPRALRHLEISYRLYREAGEFAAASRAAIALAQVESASGNVSGARGWLARAKRLIDEIGPCVEEGYYRIAMMGCEIPDVVELEASASRALEVGPHLPRYKPRS